MLLKENFFRLCVFLTCALLLNSCTKDLLIDFSKDEKKLVINSIFYPYENVTVRITSSRNILDPDSEIERVSDLYVVLANDKGEVLEVLTELGNFGVYKTVKFVPFPGEVYELTVIDESAPNRVRYTARSSIPVISEQTSIDTSVIETSSGLALNVNVLIHDQEDDDEVYIFEVGVQENGEEKLANLETTDDDVEFFSDEATAKRLYLGDDAFSGQRRSLDFRTYDGVPQDHGENEEVFTEIKMINASDELYEYYRSLEEYNLSQQIINPSTSAPVKVYSNIKREGGKLGLGIFAGANKKTLTIRH